MLKQIKLESSDVVLVDSNVVGHLSGWVDSLFRASRRLPDFGALSALILDTNHKIYFHGGFFAPNYAIPVSYGMGEDYFGQYPGTREVEMIPFYCAIVSGKLIDKLGLPAGLGASVFADAAYCLEARRAGFKLYATDKLAVVWQGQNEKEQSAASFSRKFSADAAAFYSRYGKELEGKYKWPALMMANVSGSTGFSIVARNYLRGLSENGIDMYFEPLNGVLDSLEPTNDELVNGILSKRGNMSMPQITWGQAPYFIKNSGKYKIGHCEFEATEAPQEWVPYANMMNELWVPTDWDRKKFRKAGVNVPIYVFGQGIDENYFYPDYAPARLDSPESFRFLVNAAWYPRKNLRNLILAFQSEFKKGEDVCLVVKTIDLGLNRGIKEEVKDIPSSKTSANVYIREADIPDFELPSLYTACDCFVLPTRGEGWGLPLFEALSCGLPVITTGYGAPFETLKDEKGRPYPGVHFVSYDEVPATDPYVYMEGKNWAEPNMAEFAQKMREVYENRHLEKEKARKTSEIIRRRFSWKAVTLPMAKRIREIYNKGF